MHITDQIYSIGYEECMKLPISTSPYILTLDTDDNQKDSSYRPSGH